MFFYSLVPDLGPGQGMPHRSPEEAHLLRAVLQDSINLLEQVCLGVLLNTPCNYM